MQKKTWSKILVWLGGALSMLGQQNAFGKYNSLGLTAGTALVAFGAQMASETSAGHPDGVAKPPTTEK